MKKLLVSSMLALSLIMPSCITTTSASKQAAAPKNQLVNIIKDGKYDNHNAFVDESKYSLEDIMESIEIVMHKASYNITYKDKNGSEITESREVGYFGSGVVIEKKGGKAYILTNNHVAGSINFKDLPSDVKVDKVSEEVYILRRGTFFDIKFEAKMVACDIPLDAALLEVEGGDNFKKFPYKIGNSEDLRPGDFVWVVGHPLGLEDYVLKGNVSKEYSPYNSDWFMIGCDIQQGYSGGAVIAIRDGEYELVGLVVATMTRLVENEAVDPLGGYGIAIKINPVMDLVNDYFKQKPIKKEASTP